MKHHDPKTLPKWAQRKISGLESRVREVECLASELATVVCQAAERPWPTSWDINNTRLYIAAVPFGFEERLSRSYKRSDDFLSRHK